MKIRVDVPACVGAGLCVVAAPEVFDLDDEGKVVVLNDEPGPELHDAVRKAALACPAFVIELDES